MASPRENPQLWSTVEIGPVTLPPKGVKGKARLTGLLEWENDPKKTKGKAKARTTTHGPKPTTITIEIEIQDGVSASGASYYDLTQEAIDTLIDACPGPFGIASGAASAARVQHIMVDSITIPEPDAGKLGWTIKGKRWDEPKAPLGGGGLNLSAADAKLLADLLAYLAKLEAQIASEGGSSPVGMLAQEERKLVVAKINELQSGATKTPDKSTGTKQYYQDGKQLKKPGIATGEIQP